MKIADDNFCIKQGYIINSDACTYEEDDSHEYWTAQRQSLASEYQYDVYVECAKWLLNHPSKSILEIGCGPAVKTAEFLVPFSKQIVLIDQPSIREIATKNVPESEFYSVNLESPDFTSEIKFDLIMCADVIEHLHNPDPCLELIYEHLSDQGVVFLSTPERDVRYYPGCNSSQHPAHIREWNQPEFSTYIESRRFDILRSELVPPRKLSLLDKYLRFLFDRFYKTSRWHGCQMVVAKKSVKSS
ncbi:class I SAM-dependent methyltransferase [uncultured Rubinisphaera sp.]|uniref:class I SAM-dependent methyltransferase n=1 Tax=uncultured Rubinisphaera sp. TaxID=1678686 RepID=UPI0030DCB868|tara:strand:- start:2621 stop:3352 length:732 start_codon:yes stop_codon:yes gene_type:complete